MATKSASSHAFRAAASTVVIRSGRHFAQFTVEQGIYMMLGVIRPGCDVEGGEENAIHA